jgi:hypothetical protein
VVFRYRRHTMLFILALILVAPVSFTVSFVFWDSYDVGTWENILRSLEVITLLVRTLSFTAHRPPTTAATTDVCVVSCVRRVRL